MSTGLETGYNAGRAGVQHAVLATAPNAVVLATLTSILTCKEHPMAIPRSIAVAQGKGGVGKTSVTSNVAGLAAATGAHVLVVDLDPQGNVSRDLGYTPQTGDALSIALQQGSTPPVIRDVRPNLDVVAGGPALGDLGGIALARAQRGAGTLASMLQASLSHIADDYDLILVDTPPGDRAIVEAVLATVSSVVIPTRSDDASIDGVERVAERFLAVRELNSELVLLGVILFAVSTRSARVERKVRTSLEELLGDSAPVFETTIRHLESAAVDARQRGLLVHELEKAGVEDKRQRLAALKQGKAPVEGLYARNTSGLAEDYSNLTREILLAMRRHADAVLA